jgi:hypothetical protein
MWVERLERRPCRQRLDREAGAAAPADRQAAVTRDARRASRVPVVTERMPAARAFRMLFHGGDIGIRRRAD